jgi:hypothetical protein
MKSVVYTVLSVVRRVTFTEHASQMRDTRNYVQSFDGKIFGRP